MNRLQFQSCRSRMSSERQSSCVLANLKHKQVCKPGRGAAQSPGAGGWLCCVGGGVCACGRDEGRGLTGETPSLKPPPAVTLSLRTCHLRDAAKPRSPALPGMGVWELKLSAVHHLMVKNVKCYHFPVTRLLPSTSFLTTSLYLFNCQVASNTSGSPTDVPD